MQDGIHTQRGVQEHLRLALHEGGELGVGGDPGEDGQQLLWVDALRQLLLLQAGSTGRLLRCCCCCRALP